MEFKQERINPMKLMKIWMLMAKMGQSKLHKMKKSKSKNVMNKFQMKSETQKKALKIQNLSLIQNKVMIKTLRTEINQTFHQKKGRKFTKQEEK